MKNNATAPAIKTTPTPTPTPTPIFAVLDRPPLLDDSAPDAVTAAGDWFDNDPSASCVGDAVTTPLGGIVPLLLTPVCPAPPPPWPCPALSAVLGVMAAAAPPLVDEVGSDPPSPVAVVLVAAAALFLEFDMAAVDVKPSGRRLWLFCAIADTKNSESTHSDRTDFSIFALQVQSRTAHRRDGGEKCGDPKEKGRVRWREKSQSESEQRVPLPSICLTTWFGLRLAIAEWIRVALQRRILRESAAARGTACFPE